MVSERGILLIFTYPRSTEEVRIKLPVFITMRVNGAIISRKLRKFSIQVLRSCINPNKCSVLLHLNGDRIGVPSSVMRMLLAWIIYLRMGKFGMLSNQ